VSQYIYGLDGGVIAEYDGNNDLKMWSLGGFGYKTGEGMDVSSYYYIKDHIGNIRVTINEGGSIMGKDDYYPFGLQMPGLSYNNGNENDRLKFSGKELDEEQGLKKYHFGWRDYDPELGRWNVVDPARQYASPYVYGGNNPIIGYDEDGRWFGIDDLIVSGVSFVVGYVSHGMTTGEWGKDISRTGITTDDPNEYNCKDFLFEMRANELSKDHRTVSFGDNQAHVGFDIGGDLYGHRYILSKQGANFPIKVNTARSLSNGSWLKSGFYYKGKYFNINSGRYGQWKYLEF
jgi:RHS repeat-associated protein